MTTQTLKITNPSFLNKNYYTSYDGILIKNPQDLEYAINKASEDSISQHFKEERDEADKEYSRLLLIKNITQLEYHIESLRQTKVMYGDYQHQKDIDEQIAKALYDYNKYLTEWINNYNPFI